MQNRDAAFAEIRFHEVLPPIGCDMANSRRRLRTNRWLACRSLLRRAGSGCGGEGDAASSATSGKSMMPQPRGSRRADRHVRRWRRRSICRPDLSPSIRSAARTSSGPACCGIADPASNCPGDGRRRDSAAHRLGLPAETVHQFRSGRDGSSRRPRSPMRWTGQRPSTLQHGRAIGIGRHEHPQLPRDDLVEQAVAVSRSRIVSVKPDSSMRLAP